MSQNKATHASPVDLEFTKTHSNLSPVGDSVDSLDRINSESGRLPPENMYLYIDLYPIESTKQPNI